MAEQQEQFEEQLDDASEEYEEEEEEAEYEEVDEDEYEEEEDLEEEEEEEEVEEDEQPATSPWVGLENLPAATQSTFSGLLSKMQSAGRSELTVLMLGLSGVGKSSTANTLFGEKVAPVAALVSQPVKPEIISRTAHGFTLTLIDTPGLMSTDTLSKESFDLISEAITGREIDIVLYMDRLDGYRIGPEHHAVLRELSATLGADIWSRSVLGLTRGGMQSAPPGTTLQGYINSRVNGLRKAVSMAAGKSVALPAVLIENRATCKTNEAGEKVLADGTVWMSAFMQTCVDAALEVEPLEFDPTTVKRPNPNRRRMWMIPVLLAAQIALKVFVLDRVIEEDGYKQDVYGPFDKEYAEEERRRAKLEKAARKKREKARAKRVGESRMSEINSKEDYKGFMPSGNTFTPSYEAEDLDVDLDEDEFDEDF